MVSVFYFIAMCNDRKFDWEGERDMTQRREGEKVRKGEKVVKRGGEEEREWEREKARKKNEKGGMKQLKGE